MSLRVSFFIAILFVSAAMPAFAQDGWQIRRGSGTGDLISVFFTSSSTGWVAGDEGYLAQTRDGGNTWTKRVLNTAANINEIYFRNDADGYLVAGRKLFETSDGGLNWKETFIANPTEFSDGIPEFLSIRFNSRNQGFIVGSVLDRDNDEIVIGSLLMRTVDGGKTWNRVDLPTKVELFHLDFDGRSHGWIVGDRGTILATTNNGSTWELQDSGTQEVLYNVDFRDEKDGYAVGTGGTILRTVDGGATWIKVESPVSATLFRVDFPKDKDGWIVGARGTILRTRDKGITWQEQKSNTTSHLYGLYVRGDYGWSVGKDGVIISYKD
ncbi:MAG TPA: YCF48-related protein [Aridibacter sp.]|nr:YCF48-related protein [Aridibacter sp.]